MTTGLSPSSVRWCGSYPSASGSAAGAIPARRDGNPFPWIAVVHGTQAGNPDKTGDEEGLSSSKTPIIPRIKAQVSGQASARLTDTYRQRYDSRRARVAQSIFPRAEDARRAGSGRMVTGSGGVFRAASLPRRRCDYFAQNRSFPRADWAVHPRLGRRCSRQGRRGYGNGVEPASRYEGTKRELQPDEEV